MNLVNPRNIINNSRIRKFQVLLTLWLFLIICFDGYDLVIYGAVIPSLINEWGISDVTAGMIASYSVAGMAIGAVTLGMLADKIGRKKVIIFCIVLFSLFTFLSGFATGPEMFIVFRIITGIGMGGIMPNVVTLIAEFAPGRVRTALVAFVCTGISAGAIAGALTSRFILPLGFGWQPIFWLGGIPLLLLPFIIKQVPESVHCLLVKGKVEEVKAVLRKIDSSLPTHFELELPKAERTSSPPLVKLFKDQRAFSTLMFWIACFCSMMLMFSLNTWLPSLLMQTGYDLSSSLLFVVVLQVGAIIGSIVFGRLADKIGFKKVLVPLFFAGAVALALIGFTKGTITLFVLLAVVGAASVGVQNISSVFVSEYYPAEIRSTAVGATTAFGRVGGIVAPLLIGFLLTLNLQPQYYFGTIGISALLGGIAFLFVREKYASYNQSEDYSELSESGHNTRALKQEEIVDAEIAMSKIK